MALSKEGSKQSGDTQAKRTRAARWEMIACVPGLNQSSEREERHRTWRFATP